MGKKGKKDYGNSVAVNMRKKKKEKKSTKGLKIKRRENGNWIAENVGKNNFPISAMPLLKLWEKKKKKNCGNGIVEIGGKNL